MPGSLLRSHNTFSKELLSKAFVAFALMLRKSLKVTVLLRESFMRFCIIFLLGLLFKMVLT